MSDHSKIGDDVFGHFPSQNGLIFNFDGFKKMAKPYQIRQVYRPTRTLTSDAFWSHMQSLINIHTMPQTKQKSTSSSIPLPPPPVALF